MKFYVFYFFIRYPRGRYFLLLTVGCFQSNIAMLVFLDILCIGFVSQIKDLDSSAINHRRDVRSTFCTNNFIKIPVGNIRDFSLRVPKTARQQRKMIRAVFRLNQHRFRIHFLNLRHRLVFLVGKIVVLNKHKLKSNCNSVAHSFTQDKYAVKWGIRFCRRSFWKNCRKTAHIIYICWWAVLGNSERKVANIPDGNFDKIIRTKCWPNARRRFFGYLLRMSPNLWFG